MSDTPIELNTTQDLQPHEKIFTYLKDRGINISWLAVQVTYHRSYVSDALRGNKPLTIQLRSKINEVLKTDF